MNTPSLNYIGAPRVVVASPCCGFGVSFQAVRATRHISTNVERQSAITRRGLRPGKHERLTP